ncbi:MAG: hypothetical protein Q8N63_08325 [Nanoarchaeota archaeon]|nr:hypothetical protein [Nanoarchaeota archaeon]
MEINKESLEKALKKADAKISEPKISKEEEIGVHKGALNTLVAERNELIRMIANIEAIMQAHLKRLEELGVKISPDKN